MDIEEWTLLCMPELQSVHLCFLNAYVASLFVLLSQIAIPLITANVDEE